MPSPYGKQNSTYLPPTEAYDRWAEVYDHDSNPLQAIDDLQLIAVLQEFLPLVAKKALPGRVCIIDLGCGTGRNTLKLLPLRQARIVGLDASTKMLDIARARCNERMEAIPKDIRAASIDFERFDMLDANALPNLVHVAHGIICTLVLEHIAAPEFFKVVWSLLVPGGYLLLTNMHPEMGAISQAGFRDLRTGEKFQTLSYIHTIESVVEVAGRYSFEVIGEIQERAIDAENIEKLGRRAKKWIGVRCWFSVIFQKSTMPATSND